MRAMSSTVPPFSIPNCVSVVKGVPKVPDESDFLEAIVSCSRKMLFPADPLTGVPGMMRAWLEMPAWGEKSPTPDFAARFAYQVIEKRGTGGGFFRKLYSKFLIHASKKIPAMGRGNLVGR